MKNVLVVCEGNVCRSPMAEGLLRAELPQGAVRSAGLGALVGHPADETAVRLMRERRIDISGHRAVQITRAMCLQADVVLVMDLPQRERVETLYPPTRGRVFRIGEYLKRDVPDPYRRPELVFRESLALIEQGLAEWLRRIRKLS
jgi:protein-tyrosine phosphatase